MRSIHDNTGNVAAFRCAASFAFSGPGVAPRGFFVTGGAA